MIYCKNCGTELNDNAAFCRECGAPVSRPEFTEEEAETKRAGLENLSLQMRELCDNMVATYARASSELVNASNAVKAEAEEKIKAAEAAAGEKAAECERLQNLLNSRDTEILHLQDALSGKDAALAELQNAFAAKESELAGLKDALAAKAEEALGLSALVAQLRAGGEKSVEAAEEAVEVVEEVAAVEPAAEPEAIPTPEMTFAANQVDDFFKQVDDFVSQEAEPETVPELVLEMPRISFCPNCGSRLQPDMIFCSECGTRIK